MPLVKLNNCVIYHIFQIQPKTYQMQYFALKAYFDFRL